MATTFSKRGPRKIAGVGPSGAQVLKAQRVHWWIAGSLDNGESTYVHHRLSSLLKTCVLLLNACRACCGYETTSAGSNTTRGRPGHTVPLAAPTRTYRATLGRLGAR